MYKQYYQNKDIFEKLCKQFINIQNILHTLVIFQHDRRPQHCILFLLRPES